jgi:hypothetical protein
MQGWAGCVLLASGAMCLSLVWFGQLPNDLQALRGFAALIGLVAIVTGFGCLMIAKRKK